MPDRENFEIIAHRGNGAGPDENTLSAALAAVVAGADRVELDVQLVKGELVHAHPPKRSGPLLEDVGATLKVPVILHLKRHRFSPWHDRRVVRRLAELDLPDVTVSSFWPGTLTYAKRNFPKLRTAYISWWLGYDLWFARRLGASEYHVFHRTITRRALRRAKRNKLKVIAFVPNEPRRALVGADGVMTDYVKAWRDFVARWPRQ